MKHLNIILKDIETKLNLATSKEEAINKGLEMFLYLEYARHYGGYRLVNVLVKNGGHCNAFGESCSGSRKSNKEMTNYLEGLYNGILAGNKN